MDFEKMLNKLKEVFGEWPLRVAEFHKVSYDQFRKDWINTFSEPNDEELRDERIIADAYDTLSLPMRSDQGSCGYDFYSPLSFTLDPDEEIVIPTGIKIKMLVGWYLMCCPRSGLGFKYYCRFANSMGIIDESYFGNPDNEGHCFIKLRNEGTKRMVINKGDRFCQGIVNVHGITLSDSANGIRNGGLGSTGA